MAILDPTMPQPTVPITPLAPDAPATDPYQRTPDNEAKVLKLIREREADWKPGREQFVRNAIRNIYFERGHQDIVFSRATNSWRPAVLRGPRIIPTNRFSSTMGAYVSVLARVEPLLTFRPATDDPEDRATAEVAGRAIEVIEDEVNIRLARQRIAHWAGYTGGAWLETGYDPSPQYGTRLVQDDRCLACGQQGPPQPTPECATCGGPTEPAVDELGQPMGQQVPIGRMFVEVRSCFNMWFDASYEDWRDVPEYITKVALSPQQAQERWGDDAKGVGSDLGSSVGEAYLDQLPRIAGYMAESGPGLGPVPLTRGPGQRVSETRYTALPTRDYPDGLLVITLGGTKVVHLGPLPYRDETGPIKNTVYFPTRLVPGSLWSKTVADDLASKQVERNQLCYFILRLIMRTANPVWLVPEGSNVAKFTGDPGQILMYNALGPSPAKPERVQGAGIPNGLLTWLQIIDQDFEELAATFSVMKGDRPAGVSAGIALQMLQERANNRFGPMFILWEQAWAEWARQALAIFRQHVTEPRLLKIQGRGSRWRVQKFLGSDLTGRIDVVPEAGSSMPRSTLVERAELEQLSANGIVNPRDPEIQEKWLEAFGRTNWLPGMKADAEEAAQQLEFFEQLAADPRAAQLIGTLLQQAAQMMQASMQQFQQGLIAQPLPPITYTQLAGEAEKMGLKLPKVRPMVDGHQVFARELGNWLKGDASKQLPEPIQVLVEMKFNEHFTIAQQQAMQAMQMSQGVQPTSGFLSNPGGMQGANGEPPSRMQGEAREMEQNAA